MSQLDDFFASRRGVSTEAASNPTELDTFFNDRRQQQAAAQEAQVRKTIEFATKDDPEIAAERRRLSQTSGLPLRVVEQNLAELRAKETAKAYDLVQMSKTSPILYRQLMDPQFTAESIDDVFTLQGIEQAIGGTASYLMGARPDGGIVGDLKGSIYRSAGAFAGAKRAAVDVIEPWARLVQGDQNFFAEMSKNYAAQSKGYDAQAEKVGSKIFGVSPGVQSLGQNLKYLPLALAGPGGGALALGGMVMESFGSSYNKAADKNLPLWQSLGYASADAMVEYWTEKIPMDALIGGIKQGAPLIQILGKQMALEIPGEQVATVLQNANEWATLNPGKSFKDFLAEQPSAMAETLIATIIGTGGNVMVSRALATGIDAVAGDAAWRDNLTDTYQEMLNEQLKLAGQSVFRERSPEQFRAHIQTIVSEGEGAQKEIYVDGEVLNQLPQEVLAQLPEAVREQISTAAAMGEVVAIPMADVLTFAPNTPLEQVISEHARMDPFAESQAEKRLSAEKAQERIKADTERVIQQASDQAQARIDYETVKDDLLAQITAAGQTAAQYRPAVAETYAAGLAHFFVAYGERSGKGTVGLYQAYKDRGFRIVGARTTPGRGGVLNADGGTLVDVTAQWDAAGITGGVYENRGVITLSRIVVPEGQREQGTGTAALQALVDYADRTGQRVVLSPSADFGGNKKRLVQFYKRFGFVENKGRNKDFTISEAMIREPQRSLEQQPGFDQTQTEAFKRFSNDAPLVTADAAETYDFKTGEKIVVEAFHGTKRPDRVGTKFLKKRATSGPMAYHTSDPALASSYATGKQDTSLSDEDQSYETWFKYKPKGQRSAVDIVRAWNFLDTDTKVKIAETAPTLRLNEDLDGVIAEEGNTRGNGSYDYNLSQTRTSFNRQGNPIKALVEDWLNSGNLFNEEETFMEVLQKAGFPMADVTYDSPTAEYPFVYKNYIAMQKPLVTSDVPQEVADALNAAAKKDRSRAKAAGADMWDKNTRTLKSWVDAFNEPDNKYVWTSIPDKVTDVFRSLGYDGIVDWSGKGGGTVAPVYIPFEETQVKSALGNKGKFDATKNDILRQDAVDQPLLAPNGQPSNLTPELYALVRTPEFKAWFGDSKVVDADGKPLVVYHGTNAHAYSPGESIEVFNTRPISGRGGAFFTDSQPLAEQYGERVYSTYLSMQNPLVVYADGKGWTTISGKSRVSGSITDAARQESERAAKKLTDVFAELDALFDEPIKPVTAKAKLPADAADLGGKTLGDLPGLDGEALETDVVVKAARRLGYDGVIFKNVQDSPTADAGYKRVLSDVFAVFNPTQIKSATGNDGSFNPADPNIYKQGPRGTFSPSSLELVLNPNADLSTLWHEMGHFFLEVMADVATQPNAPAPIVADYQAFLTWAGVSSEEWAGFTLDQKRPYHERWAETVEQYIMEGKVPNVELQPLLRRFRSWMLSLYGSIQKFLADKPDAERQPLNEDIRRVLDRMLATDAQIAQAEEVAGMVPEFDATNEAREKLEKRSMRDLRWTRRAYDAAIKRIQKTADTIRKNIKEEVRAEVEQQPLYKAMNWLKKGETTDPATGDVVKAEKGYRLLTTALAEMYPETMLSRPDLTGLRGMTGKEGLHPDMVADMFGFESGDKLVRAILDAEPITSVIEGMTEQRMLEEHGDLIDERAVQEAANEAVHNEARARSLATELRSQAEMLNARTDTGETNARGAKITTSTLMEAAKLFAANVVARTPLRDLKNRAWQHTAAERRAAKHWQEATAAGKTEEAVKAKQDQVLNNAAARAALDAKAEMGKILEFFKRVVKNSDEKTVEKGRDPDVVNAARAILAAYGIETNQTKRAAEYMAILANNDPAMYAALQPYVDGALQLAQPIEALTFEELQSLHDTISQLWYLAKSSRQSEIDGNLVDREELEDALVARMGEIGIPDTIPGEKGAITDRQELGIKLQFAKSILSRVEQWAERLDGKFGGPFLRYVFQPIKEAADRYRTDKVSYRKKFTELLKNVAPALPAGPIEAPELGYTFGNARDSGAAELLHAILHTGNDSNKRKLLLGRGWATQDAEGNLDTTQWDAFIQRMQGEGKLNQKHYDFAQGVWDLLEDMKPLAQKTHRKVFGRYFAEITANEFTTPFGTYRGGYVPAQTDGRLVKDAKLRELAEGENESMAYAFPAAPSGFTKSRVEYNQPLLLDLRALGQHMDKVLLFSHMQGAVTDVRRLLTSKRVSYALDRIDPGAYEGMLIPWLNRSARQVVETPVVGDRKISRFLSAARSRAGMALMFANLSNTVQQVTGFTMAGVKVKPGLIMSATARFMADPKAMKTAVAGASPYMQDRMLNEVGAMNDAIEEILIDPTLLERGQAWTQRHAYFMQAAVDNTMSPIIWTAAYNQAIEQGMDERDAVRFADGVIRQTQGTTLPEDISRFESGPGYARLFTQFVSYFNMMANTNATAVKQIADEVGLKKGAGKVLYVALAGLLAPIWVAEAIAQAFRGGPEDEDKDGWLDDWLLAVFGMGTLKGLTAQIPIVGQAGQLVINRFNDNPADDKFSLSPAVSLIESTVSAPSSVYKAIVEDGNKQRAVRDVAAAATMITGLPIYGVARPIGYLAGIAGGNIEPTGPVDLARGIVTGTASPESKQR